MTASKGTSGLCARICRGDEGSSRLFGWFALSPVLALALAAAACGESDRSGEGTTEAPITRGPAQPCQSLLELSGDRLGESTARILSAALNAASEAKTIPGAPAWAPGIPALPEHCEVIGVMRERVGAHGQSYGVKFRLRLPAVWNERFLFEGGGGTNGNLGQAFGRMDGGPHALDRGFAVVSTDTGHDNAANNDPERQGTVAFGHDYEARLEYAEKALDSVATAAKSVIEAYYGGKPRYNYFAGCSNGGREGMVFAQRFPEQFDGIVASAPAFAVPKAAIAEVWDTKLFAGLAQSAGLVRADGLPDLSRTFSPSDFALVSKAVLQVCDGDDGLEDGMIQRPTECTNERVRPALEAKICKGEKTAECVSQRQVDALAASLAGPRNSGGEPLYADWPWDAGIGSQGWAIWKLGAPGGMDAINIMLGSTALSGLFVTPPDVVASDFASSLRYQMEFDFDEDAPKIFGVSEAFPRSGWDLVGAQSTDLKAFAESGGKMLIPHGASDPIFSVTDTLAWWRKLDQAEQGKAAEFARAYVVPGMAHCMGGPATDRYDSLSAVMEWVEKGVAPDRLEAKAGAMSPWPGRTRPLCAYPSYAKYDGGDPESAESFSCVEP